MRISWTSPAGPPRGRSAMPLSSRYFWIMIAQSNSFFDLLSTPKFSIVLVCLRPIFCIFYQCRCCFNVCLCFWPIFQSFVPKSLFLLLQCVCLPSTDIPTFCSSILFFVTCVLNILMSPLLWVGLPAAFVFSIPLKLCQILNRSSFKGKGGRSAMPLLSRYFWILIAQSNSLFDLLSTPKFSIVLVCLRPIFLYFITIVV